jgi:hypothetical protein
VLNTTWTIADNKMSEFKRRTHESVEVAATRLQNRMVRKAREIASQRHRTGAMEAGIHGTVKLAPTGVTITLADTVWYSHFQDHGTKRGVTPLLFLEEGVAEGHEYAVPEIAAEGHDRL